MGLQAREVAIKSSLVNAALENLCNGSGFSLNDKTRLQILAIMRTAYDEGRGKIRARFEQDSDAMRAIDSATDLIDQLVTILFQFAGTHFFGNGENHLKNHLAIVAVGGYGREELFPYSDIDILFLHDKEGWQNTVKIAEFILYLLWDLGLQVGQSVRTVEDAIARAKNDITICSSLLDMRFVCGSKKLFTTLEKRFWKDVVTEQSVLGFVEAKLAERDARHQRCGDSRYVLEPNIKDGKGGLRDLQTLYWISRYAYKISRISELVKTSALSAEEYRQYTKAQRFLWNVRTHLHLLAERAEERLTFEMQRTIAEKMGYRDRASGQGVERFMKIYFLNAKHVGSLTRVLCALLEEEHKRKLRLPFTNLLANPAKLSGFRLDAGRLNVPHDAFFKEKPSRLLQLFSIAQEMDVDIHPHSLRLISHQLSLITPTLRDDPEANQLFLNMLTSPKQPDLTLRRMNEAGVLGKFIPDFGRVVGQMQYDRYHVYTVDEHTIHAIGLLNQVALGKLTDIFPLASKIIHQVASKRVLSLAVFCHDIAKGRGGDHSVLGERVARNLATRLGFDAEEIENTAWLVRMHLLFSHTAFKRDVTEPKTVADFVEKVQSPERLRLLLILTAVDIRAVGPQVWNTWKGGLLRELYYRAEVLMGGAEPTTSTGFEAELKAGLVTALPDLSEEARTAYIELGTEAFLTNFDVATHARIATLLGQKMHETGPIIDIEVDTLRAITRVLVLTEDQKALFSLLAGALSSSGANILSAKAFTLKNGVAVDQFSIQNTLSEAFSRPDRIGQLKSNIKQFIKLGAEGEVTAIIHKKSAQKQDPFKVPPRVIVENNVSSHHTVVEVNGRDRLGFLYSITRALAELELSISTAHISSYGERAVDVFYVKDKFGMKIWSDVKLKQIRDTLMEVMMAQALPQALKTTG